MEENKLFVGNLDYSVTKDELIDLFSSFGSVISAIVIKDKGIGFVEMEDEAEAQNALLELNDFCFKKRKIKIDRAKPKKNDKKPVRRSNYGRKN